MYKHAFYYGMMEFDVTDDHAFLKRANRKMDKSKKNSTTKMKISETSQG